MYVRCMHVCMLDVCMYVCMYVSEHVGLTERTVKGEG